jgi:hypothetical protein
MPQRRGATLYQWGSPAGIPIASKRRSLQVSKKASFRLPIRPPQIMVQREELKGLSAAMLLPELLNTPRNLVFARVPPDD